MNQELDHRLEMPDDDDEYTQPIGWERDALLYSYRIKDRKFDDVVAPKDTVHVINRLALGAEAVARMFSYVSAPETPVQVDDSSNSYYLEH